MVPGMSRQLFNGDFLNNSQKNFLTFFKFSLHKQVFTAFHSLFIGLQLEFEKLSSYLEKTSNSGREHGMADLANASVLHPRDLGSNLDIERKYFLVLFVSHLSSNL
jgi:hypothetical protein